VRERERERPRPTCTDIHLQIFVHAHAHTLGVLCGTLETQPDATSEGGSQATLVGLALQQVGAGVEISLDDLVTLKLIVARLAGFDTRQAKRPPSFVCLPGCTYVRLHVSVCLVCACASLCVCD
jgi:hypothetical protein